MEKKQNLAEVYDQIKFYQEDIRDFEALKKILKNVDGIFHQAALTVVQDSLKKTTRISRCKRIRDGEYFQTCKRIWIKGSFCK